MLENEPNDREFNDGSGGSDRRRGKRRDWPPWRLKPPARPAGSGDAGAPRRVRARPRGPRAGPPADQRALGAAAPGRGPARSGGSFQPPQVLFQPPARPRRRPRRPRPAPAGPPADGPEPDTEDDGGQPPPRNAAPDHQPDDQPERQAADDGTPAGPASGGRRASGRASATAGDQADAPA